MKITFTKFFLLFSVLLIFGMSSCEKDLYDDGIYQSNFKVEKFSLNQNKSKVALNSNFLKAVSNFRNKHQNVSGKIVYDSINNFYFDDDKGIKITKDDYESYTFKIIKEGNVENLVFCKNLDGEFYAYKIIYSLNEQQLRDLSTDQMKQISTNFIDIDDISTQSLVAMCGHWELELHQSPRDESYTPVLVCITDFCDGGGGTGDGSGYGGNNSTGYGDGGNNNNPPEPNGGGGGGGGGTTPPVSTPPIVTSPVFTLEDDLEIETPCDELENLLKTEDTIFINEYETLDTIKRPKLKQT